MNELRDRIARMPAVEAVGLIGVAMTLVGVAVTVDALVEASRATTGAALLAWYDRLLLGLWELRIESTAWFTAGLVVLWWALAHDARLGGYRRDASRAAGGLAVGFALVAVAVAIGATIVALRGEVAGVTFTQSERLLTWLLQIATAAGAGAVWTVLAVKLPPADSLVADEPWEEDAQDAETEPPAPASGEVLGPPPELPAPDPGDRRRTGSRAGAGARRRAVAVDARRGDGDLSESAGVFAQPRSGQGAARPARHGRAVGP